MKIQINKRTIEIEGFMGDIVEVDAEKGNRLATLGIVTVIEHDAPQTPYRPPMKKRDYRPKWLKLAEAAGEDVSNIVVGSQLLKPEEAINDEE